MRFIETQRGSVPHPESPLQADMRWIVESIYGPNGRLLTGLDIGRAYLGATEDFRYGGDMVDVFGYQDGSVSLAVVDITGHGVRAATHASLAKYALRAYASRGLSALESVRSLNRLCIENSEFEIDEEFFATVFFAIIDSNRGRMEYVSAGHEATYIFHGVGSTILDATGPIVGLLDDDRAFSHGIIPLSPGDIVAAVTDGFTEARNVAREFLGPEAIVDVVNRSRLLSAESQANAIANHAYEYAGALHDDVAALVIKIKIPEPSATNQ